MRERALLVGGALTIGPSSDGAGNQVELRIGWGEELVGDDAAEGPHPPH